MSETYTVSAYVGASWIDATGPTPGLALRRFWRECERRNQPFWLPKRRQLAYFRKLAARHEQEDGDR